MEIANSFWHIASACTVLALGALTILGLRSYFFIGSLRALTLYIYHTIWCAVYLWYVIQNGGDAIGYYEAALYGNPSFRLGTSAISFLTAILIQDLGLSILGGFLVFNVFGTVGLLAFDATLRTSTQSRSRNLRSLSSLIVFLPSASFWSSAIGKDAIAFMSICLTLWATLDMHRRYKLMIFSLACMLMVRPHMAGLMILGIAASLFWSDSISTPRKITLGLASITAAALIVPFALEYAGISDNSIQGLAAYVELRQGFNMEGDGGIDISTMSLPMQIFTYLFRPLFFDAKTIPQVAASFDNAILLYLSIAGGLALLRKTRGTHSENRVFLWIYTVLALMALSMTTANLGISVRQKWMFLPMLIFLLLSAMGRKHDIHHPSSMAPSKP